MPSHSSGAVTEADSLQEAMPDSASTALQNTASKSFSPTTGLPEQFCSEIAPQATRYAMSIVRSWADAEEIVQEAFCKLIVRPGAAATETAALRAILFTIVRNQAIDRLRRKGQRRFEVVDQASLVEVRPQSNDATLRQLETGVQASLSAMPEQWSEALQLKINGELTYAEIADLLSATHAQVRTWIFRARQRMARELSAQGLIETCESRSQ